jgi:hypothetical protein
MSPRFVTDLWLEARPDYPDISGSRVGRLTFPVRPRDGKKKLTVLNGAEVVGYGLIDYQDAAGRQIDLFAIGMHAQVTAQYLHRQAAGGSVFVNCRTGIDRGNHHPEVGVMDDRL